MTEQQYRAQFDARLEFTNGGHLEVAVFGWTCLTLQAPWVPTSCALSPRDCAGFRRDPNRQ